MALLIASDWHDWREFLELFLGWENIGLGQAGGALVWTQKVDHPWNFLNRREVVNIF
jgi:hypothetical protein